MNKSEQRAYDILLTAYNAKRLHHSILLYGPSLNGLEEVAKTLASQILKCADCTKHPDFFTLRPEGKMRIIKIGSDSEKSRGNWPQNTMRHLLAELRQTSNAGGAKVALVYEADRMNQESANAFLKTLEEPPQQTTIILITQRANDILDTIKSRCIIVKIQSDAEGIDDEQWSEWIGDFENWIKKCATPANSKEAVANITQCYSLLSRFVLVAKELSDSVVDEATSEELDDEQLEAIKACERKSLTKKMLSQMENAVLNSASSGEISISKIGACTEKLEQCASLMELNLKDTTALEYFMLSALRILSAKD